MQQPTRQQKRKATAEAKNLNIYFLQIIGEFKKEVLALGPIHKSDFELLEVSRYGTVYRKHLKTYYDTVDTLVKQRKFKYSQPDREYFKRRFNPIDGAEFKGVKNKQTK